MILFSLFYFVPENEKDMFSGFGLFRAGIVHFRREKGNFCKIDINKKDALEWGIGIEMEQISCFVKFYLTETL